MELDTMQYTPAKYSHHAQFMNTLVQSRKRQLLIKQRYFGVLHVRDDCYSAIAQFAAITKPQTRFEQAPKNPRYWLATDEGELELDIQEAKTCLEGQVVAVDGECSNRRLTGRLLQYNEIINVREVPQAAVAGVLLFSDIQGDLGRLALYANMPRDRVQHTVIGGSTFPDLLRNNFEHIMQNYEFSPMDEYFSMATDFSKIDAVVSQFQNATLMTGFTDPSSIEFPQPPLAKVCMPDSQRNIKCVGNPACADVGGKKVVFINYGIPMDLDQIVRAGHMFPQVGFHFACQQMESDCFCTHCDVLVVFGQPRSFVRHYSVRSAGGSDSEISVVSVAKRAGVIVDLAGDLSWSCVNI